MTDLNLNQEYEPGSPEFLVAVRRDVPEYVIAANDEHDAAYQQLLEDHAQHRNLIEMSDEDEAVKHNLVNRHRKDTRRAIHQLRAERAEAIRRGISQSQESSQPKTKPKTKRSPK